MDLGGPLKIQKETGSVAFRASDYHLPRPTYECVRTKDVTAVTGAKKNSGKGHTIRKRFAQGGSVKLEKCETTEKRQATNAVAITYGLSVPLLNRAVLDY